MEDDESVVPDFTADASTQPPEPPQKTRRLDGSASLASEPAPFTEIGAAVSRNASRFVSDRRLRHDVVLASALGERVAEHDWRNVGPVVAALKHRYFRESNRSLRSFPREMTWSLVDALRAGGGDSPSDDADQVVRVLRAAISAPDTYAVSGTSRTHRVAAALELIFEECARGNADRIFEDSYSRTTQGTFAQSATYRSIVGSLALFLAQREDVYPLRTKKELLQAAIELLEKAHRMDPTTHFHVHQLANALEASNEATVARMKLTEFCRRNPRDPSALNDVLRRDPRDVKSATALLALDPMSERALQCLAQHAGDWQPMAQSYAARIECGDITAWTKLDAIRSVHAQAVRTLIWERGGRRQWWPEAYFQPPLAPKDLAADREVARAKASIARAWTHDKPGVADYVREVESGLGIPTSATLTRSVDTDLRAPSAAVPSRRRGRPRAKTRTKVRQKRS